MIMQAVSTTWSYDYWINLVSLLLILWFFLALVKMNEGMPLFRAILGGFIVALSIGWFYLGMMLWVLK